MNSGESLENFNFEILIEQGQTLTEKAVDVHMIDGREFLARWYYSHHQADLMIWFGENHQIERFQLNSIGQIVDWSRVDGLHTGLIVEHETESGYVETIKFDSILDTTNLSRAKIVIENCSGLKSSVKSSLLEALTATDSELKPGVSAASGRVTSSRSRFWNRFKSWTIGT